MYISAQLKLVLALLLTSSLTGAVELADPPVKRTVLQKIDIPAGMIQECVLAMAELKPGASIGRHTHPGVETGYVLEGSLTLIIDGEQPKVLKKNATYTIEAGKVHDAMNVGKSVATVLGTWVIEKGKPLSQPAN